MNDVNRLAGNVLWGTDLTVDNGLGLRSWYGQCDIFGYSYAWAGDPKIADVSLFDQIAADDVRKTHLDLVGSIYIHLITSFITKTVE